MISKMSIFTHFISWNDRVNEVDCVQFILIHGPNIPGSYATVFFIISDFISPSDTSITEHCFHLGPAASFILVVVVVQTISYVPLFVMPWTAACQTSPSFTISQWSLKFVYIESVMPSNHLILCRPLLLLPSVFPSIRVFSNELVIHIRWPKY